MRRLSIDFETYSSIPLKEAGVYRYIESPDFEILLLGYAFDDDAPTVIDLTTLSDTEKEETKKQFEAWLNDPEIICSGYNVEFECAVFSKWFGYNVDLNHWWDTMVAALSCGLPRSLKDVGTALGMKEEDAKLREGKALVTYFCTPCKPTKVNGGRTRNLPEHNPEKWAKFVEYNRQDVVAERAIWKRIQKYEPDQKEHDVWVLSTEINRRGVMLDRSFAENAVRISEEHTEILMKELREITHLENPNSVVQLSQWLGMKSLTKDTVAEELQTAVGNRKRVLEIRREIGKSSVKKYEAMLNAICDDDRARGLFAFYGANRTGRYSSRLIQLQNLPQNHIDDLDNAREIVADGDRELLEIMYGDVPDTLSQLIRTAFIAKPGHTFAVADFSAIEARLVAWLSDEQWRIDLFKNGGDIYCQSASQMFHVPVVKHGINGHLRQKGKIAELACIAHDSLVLTDIGLVPIQDVTLDMKLWDGEEWVKHGGVIYKGEQNVITYDGLTATPDHLVWVEGLRNPIHFERAKAGGRKLLRTGKDKGQDYRRSKDGSTRQEEKLERHTGKVRVYDIRNAGPHHRFTVSNCLVHNCGYGGSANAMVKMGALKMGLTEEELPDIVAKWREASPHVVNLWWAIDRKVKDTLINGSVNNLMHGCSCWKSPAMLHIGLPSGRVLRYFKPHIEDNAYGKTEIVYQAYDQGKWGTGYSYGPKFLENVTQAIARDCLTTTMQRVSERYPDIVMHVHDELIVEVPEDEAEEALAYICDRMAEPIPWAPGLLLRGDGYITKYYRKD